MQACSYPVTCTLFVPFTPTGLAVGRLMDSCVFVSGNDRAGQVVVAVISSEIIDSSAVPRVFVVSGC